MSYNSCRNRHCPTCQGHKREEWIEARKNEFLPVAYFHVVFTMSDHLNVVCLQFPKEVYGIVGLKITLRNTLLQLKELKLFLMRIR